MAQVTFRELFVGNYGGVLIPVIQRDYAQGRRSKSEVRRHFLEALKGALDAQPDDPALPLDLDFIYGSRLDSTAAFVPLDGQQRLTTLFLLHWYLALRDGQSERFESLVTAGGEPRFVYEVRPSSGDFFAHLSTAQDSRIELEDLLPPDQEHANALSKTLTNKPWFFLSWRLDPTIQAALHMLDAIHATFRDTSGLYERLAMERRVTFQLLRLEAFGLGDDLYIKMNARGKPLTRFEAFKAHLEQYIRAQHLGLDLLPAGTTVPSTEAAGLAAFVGHRMDTGWCNFFWEMLRGMDGQVPNKAVEQLDVLRLNAMRAVALAAFDSKNIDGVDERQQSVIEDSLEQLHSGALGSFYDYERHQFVTPAFVAALIRLLELWSGGGRGLRHFLQSKQYYDEEAMFKKVLLGRTSGDERVSYTDWVRFTAHSLYLLSDLPRSRFDEWMRVVSNLAHNSPIDQRARFRRALAATGELLHASRGDLLTRLADSTVTVRGFRGQQVREERLKAQLIRRSSEWRLLIETAETHPYFRGQVEFLFDACALEGGTESLLQRWLGAQQADWSDAEDVQYQVLYQARTAQASALFSAAGGEIPPPLVVPLWRALLCEGDYTLQVGKRTSLVVNPIDKRESWKALLRADARNGERSEKRDVFLRVLARIDINDVLGSLERLANAGVRPDADGTESWRGPLVESPKLLHHCANGNLHLEGENVYVLLGTNRGPYYALREWHLAKSLAPEIESGGLAPFDSVSAPQQWGTASEPFVELRSSAQSNRACRIFVRGTTACHVCVVQRSSTHHTDGADPSWQTTHERTVDRDDLVQTLATLAGER